MKSIALSLGALFAIGFANASYPAGDTPLAKYVREHQYTPFEIPRGNWGVGTVLSFPKGAEELIQYNEDCLKLKMTKPSGPARDIQSADAGLDATSYTISRSAALELALPKILSRVVDLGAAFNDARVVGVEVSFTEPKEYVVSTGRLRKRVPELVKEHADQCIEDIFNKDNIVVSRVLGVSSLQYSFRSKSGDILKLDAKLLNGMGLTGDAARNLEGSTSIEVKTPVLIGYRAYQFKAKGGLADSPVSIVELTPAQVRSLASANK